MIEVALQTFGSDVIAALNLVISGVAALISLLLLWFTALRGPDIRLVSSQRKVEYVEPPRADLSLTRIEFNQLDIVFVNNGSRSGALIEIVTSFKPSKGFEPFFWQEYVTAELRTDRSQEPTLQLPVVIPDRGTIVVTLKIGLLLRPWKDVTKLAQVQGDLSAALKTIWNEGRGLLGNYADLNDPIGTLEILVRKTIRKRLRATVSDSVASKL